jgi:multiple sugar transport system permease protein
MEEGLLTAITKSTSRFRTFLALNHLTLSQRENVAGWFFIMPWVLGFIIFTAGPLIASLLLSFMKWDNLGGVWPTWIGLFNFRHIFTRDPDFWQALTVTLKYTMMTLPMELILGLGLALLLNMKLRGINYYRTMLYLPSVLPAVAVVMLWKWLFQPDFGLINYTLDLVGLQGPAWFSSPTWALPALALMHVWAVGGSAIIYLAGLQNVPPVLYEVAEIDGANLWQRFWRITIPMISPTIFFSLVIGLIGILQTFTTAFVATRGGPQKSTLFYMILVYDNAFQYFHMGYAAALAWILAVLILTITALVFKSSEMWVYYEAEVKENK